MPEVKSFVEWLALAAAFAGATTPAVMAIVQLSGKFVAGKAQLAAAAVVGLVFGVLGFLGFFGVPAVFMDYFKLLVYVAMCIGIPVGTYEALKHAARKGTDLSLDEEEDVLAAIVDE